MTEQVRRPEGTGFYLADGELTMAGSAEQTLTFDQPVDFSVTAGLSGGVDMDVVLASWSTEHAEDLAGVRPEDGRSVLPLRIQPSMLNSLPSSVRVQLRTAAGLHDTEGIWQLTLHFRNQAGSGLTWHASLPTEAFGTGWLAPLSDLLTIDSADRTHDAASAQVSPAVTVVHHAEDEYYELLIDGERAGILVYHVIDAHLSITHTIIEQGYRGRGLSWVLIRGALDDLHTRSVTVSNYCAVVSRFVEKNPEYRDLFSVLRTA
jgi:predicted GNAT family acetyltransferase